MATRNEVRQFVSSGVQAIGIDSVETVIKDVLRYTQAKHVVSVGAGHGILEATLQLPIDVKILTIDPNPGSFVSSRPIPEWIPTSIPAYPTIDELLLDEFAWEKLKLEGVILLLVWPPRSDTTGYDTDAIERLQPRGVVTISDPTGFSGSRDLNIWLKSLRDSFGGISPYADLLCASEDASNEMEATLKIDVQFALTHDIKCPGYLTPLPKGTLEAARQTNGICELVVDTTLADTLGILWDGRTKVVKSVIDGSALALSGGSSLGGWRLTLVNGACPRFPQDVDEMFQRETKLDLQFIKDPMVAMVFTCTAAVRTDLQRWHPRYERREGILASWPL